MWGFSPVNRREVERLANDGSRYVWPSRVSTHIDTNRVKRSALSPLVFRQSIGVLLTIGGHFPRMTGKTDSHGRSFTTNCQRQRNSEPVSVRFDSMAEHVKRAERNNTLLKRKNSHFFPSLKATISALNRLRELRQR